MECKKCWWRAFHKAGFVRWLQRYKCKGCWCFNTDTQARWASMKVKLDALRLYALWLWLRAIGKFVGFSNVAVLKWMKEFGVLAEKIHKEQIFEWREIEIIEMDELRSFVQKKGLQFEYGRLSIDKTKDLLILPSGTDQKKLEKNYENN
jgi:transposase-like protein